MECDIGRFSPNNAKCDAEDDGISWMTIVAIVVGSVMIASVVYITGMADPLLSVAMKHGSSVERHVRVP